MSHTFLDILRRLVKTGNLKAILASGQEVELGDGTGTRIVMRTTDKEAENAILFDPALKFGEMYMDGRLLVEEGNIFDVIDMMKRNGLENAATVRNTVTTLLHLADQQLRSHLPINRNRQNVAHHYDLDARLFDLFLDQDWQYSCGYFDPPDISLDEAQLAKKRHIAAKLLLEPGQRVLEVGSGWGGMAMYLAESSGVDVTGITLSEEQLKVSRERAEKRDLQEKVRFLMQDYRTMYADPFDRIVSVGMFEHVGMANYDNFFRKMAELMAPKGVMVLHAIGQAEKPWATNPWIEKYIFPGGYMPSLAEVLPAIQKAHLMVKDIEILPMHYAHTLRAWRERFTARKEEAIRLYDERFFRMWEFYLAASETAFIHDKLMIFQIQLSKEQDAVPYTRNYIPEREAALRIFEATRRPLEPVTL